MELGWNWPLLNVLLTSYLTSDMSLIFSVVGGPGDDVGGVDAANNKNRNIKYMETFPTKKKETFLN